MGFDSRWRSAVLLVSTLLGLKVMSFGQDTVKLLRLKKLSRTADALPRIAHPSPAQVKLNHSFALIDKSARGSADSCRGPSEEGDEMFYNRSIEVISLGPLFLSVYLSEEIGCGGVHPYVNLFTFTYDLHTGEPVHWAKLLTKVHAEEVSVNPGNMLPVEIFGVSSLALQKLYSAGWKADGQCQLEDVVDPLGETITTFLLSPAPHKQGISALPTNLASAAAICAQPVVLGNSAMDELGIPDDIQRSLLAEP
jgi:hypothetical protein